MRAHYPLGTVLGPQLHGFSLDAYYTLLDMREASNSEASRWTSTVGLGEEREAPNSEASVWDIY